jgi:GT2 family glycosyltransferase
MPKIYISIVSHHNDDHIILNADLREINRLDNVTVIIRDNVASSKLKDYCFNNEFQYNSSNNLLGFGANNNKNFELAVDLGMVDDDWFILINPDVAISAEMIEKLSDSIGGGGSKLFAINLFSDEQFTSMEQSLRKYPTFFSFMNVFKGKSFTEAYQKVELSDYSEVDWAAGSFLVFNANLYKSLNGFDEKYFMYFEDVDICFRANKLFGEKTTYLRDIQATHEGGYQNRNIFSPHFRWYFKSLFRFLFKSTFRKV